MDAITREEAIEQNPDLAPIFEETDRKVEQLEREANKLRWFLRGRIRQIRDRQTQRRGRRP